MKQGLLVLLLSVSMASFAQAQESELKVSDEASTMGQSQKIGSETKVVSEGPKSRGNLCNCSGQRNHSADPNCLCPSPKTVRKGKLLRCLQKPDYIKKGNRVLVKCLKGKPSGGRVIGSPV